MKKYAMALLWRPPGGFSYKTSSINKKPFLFSWTFSGSWQGVLVYGGFLFMGVEIFPSTLCAQEKSEAKIGYFPLSGVLRRAKGFLFMGFFTHGHWPKVSRGVS